MIFFSYVSEIGFDTSVWDDCLNPDKRRRILHNLVVLMSFQTFVCFYFIERKLNNVQIILYTRLIVTRTLSSFENKSSVERAIKLTFQSSHEAIIFNQKTWNIVILTTFIILFVILHINSHYLENSCFPSKIIIFCPKA